jgi:putative PIN family toxin of toxin-antitoxin system
MSHGPSYEILEAWRRNEFILLTSKAIMKEVGRVLRYPRIQKKYHLSEMQISQVINSLNKYAVVTLGALKLKVIKEDPPDNEVLACAVEGKADFIVSGDADLRRLSIYRGIRIIEATEFVKRILHPNT